LTDKAISTTSASPPPSPRTSVALTHKLRALRAPPDLRGERREGQAAGARNAPANGSPSGPRWWSRFATTMSPAIASDMEPSF
jgi:hypothetical protein